jgi:hypothetical protein
MLDGHVVGRHVVDPERAEDEAFAREWSGMGQRFGDLPSVVRDAG